MNSSSLCPVCGFEGTLTGKSNCPQCDADLTCFRIIETLPGEKAAKEKGKRSLLPYCFLIPLLIMSLYQARKIYRIEENVNKVDLKTLSLKKAITLNDSAIAVLKNEGVFSREINTNSQTTVSQKKADDVSTDEFFIYFCKDDDTLWEISEHFYKKGEYYPVLIEHNRGIGIYGIGKGVKLKIMRNIEKVKTTYKNIIFRRDSSAYMKYKIVEGDTVESIAKKFYKKKELSGMIENLNPNLKVGDRITVLLR